MEDWLGHPAVQAGAIPFIVALAVAAFVAPTRWAFLAPVAGFIACATLAVGWSMESLNAIRKLALIGAGTALLCVTIETARIHRRAAEAFALLALCAGTTWMLWRLLAQKDGGAAILAAVLAMAYVATLAASIFRSDDPVRAASGAWVLGVGTGAVAILGASALLGITAMGAGVAAAATLLAMVARGSAAAGRSAFLPAIAVAALAGAAAVIAAQLPWYALLPMMLVIPIARLAPARIGALERAIVASSLGALPAAVSVALAWYRPA